MNEEEIKEHSVVYTYEGQRKMILTLEMPEMVYGM